MVKNLIVILLDGARWDRVDTSVDFSEIKQKGVFLNNVSTALPYTIGSVNACFSGLYGKENGIDAYYKMFRLKESIKTLPELLHENGYFTACDLLSERIIRKKGFDIHQAHDEYKDDLSERHPKFLKQCIEKANGKPLFLFLHFTRIHTVTVSEVLKKYEWDDEEFYKRKDENMKNYDKVFEEAGKYSKKILSEIDKSLEDTVVIFFSDHGTGVGERFGERNYGSFTFEETIRTFYLFLHKQFNTKTSSSLRESIDILPTLMELLEIKLEKKLPGESFSKFILNNNEKLQNKKYTFSETGALHGPYPSPKEPNVFCIKNSKEKLIYYQTPQKWEYFDLEKDPNELENKFDENDAKIIDLKDILTNWMNRN